MLTNEIVQRRQDKKELRKLATRIMRLNNDLLDIEAVDIHVSYSPGDDTANDCLQNLLTATRLALQLSGMNADQIQSFIYLHSQKD